MNYHNGKPGQNNKYGRKSYIKRNTPVTPDGGKAKIPSKHTTRADDHPHTKTPIVKRQSDGLTPKIIEQDMKTETFTEFVERLKGEYVRVVIRFPHEMGGVTFEEWLRVNYGIQLVYKDGEPRNVKLMSDVFKILDDTTPLNGSGSMS